MATWRTPLNREANRITSSWLARRHSCEIRIAISDRYAEILLHFSRCREASLEHWLSVIFERLCEQMKCGQKEKYRSIRRAHSCNIFGEPREFRRMRSQLKYCYETETAASDWRTPVTWYATQRFLESEIALDMTLVFWEPLCKVVLTSKSRTQIFHLQIFPLIKGNLLAEISQLTGTFWLENCAGEVLFAIRRRFCPKFQFENSSKEQTFFFLPAMLKWNEKEDNLRFNLCWSDSLTIPLRTESEIEAIIFNLEHFRIRA